MNFSIAGIARNWSTFIFATGISVLFLPALALAAPSSQGSGTDALSTRLKHIQSQLPEFKHHLDDLKDKGQDISYPLVTDTVLENFTAYAIEDLGIRTPSGWGMMAVNGAAASAQVVKDAHSGQWAIAIVNHTPRQPNVYGMRATTIFNPSDKTPGMGLRNKMRPSLLESLESAHIRGLKMPAGN